MANDECVVGEGLTKSSWVKMSTVVVDEFGEGCDLHVLADVVNNSP